MDWEKFFTLEAIPAYLALLVTVAIWVYRAWESRQGHHVICMQSEPPLSHLHLSDTAREWVKVQYIPQDQHAPVQIDTLSQTIIEIWNDSNVDSLNDVELEFCIPDARVLWMWWEEGPSYLLEHSQLGFSPEEEAQIQSEESEDSPWKARAFLPQLKSWWKHKEPVALGILADGNLETIEMIPQGSKEGVPPNQVWTARFVSFKRLGEMRAYFAGLSNLYWTTVLLIVLIVFGWVIFALGVRWEPLPGVPGWSLLAAFLAGSISTGGLGFVLQKGRVAKYKPPPMSRWVVGFFLRFSR